MTSTRLNFENFKAEKLSKNQQKAVRGGDGEVPVATDPGKGQGNGNT